MIRCTGSAVEMPSLMVPFALPACLAVFLSLSTALLAVEVSLGEVRVLPPPRGDLPIYKYTPDGHHTCLRRGDKKVMFWPGADSYRSVGDSLWEMQDCGKVLPMGKSEDFDNGGAWLYAVFPQSGQRMLGFYHAEDHRFSGDSRSRWIAYKSIARCVSEDGGKSWHSRERILTSRWPKPVKPAWSGLGDHCVVWDMRSKRYVCFFQEGSKLCMAASEDKEGRAGTWMKWYKGAFSEPGLGGRVTPLPAFKKHQGGNPSVTWNTYLRCWIIVWHRWKGDLWISTSENLIDWASPQLLLGSTRSVPKVWYPTILGETDSISGRVAQLLYAEFADGQASERRNVIRQIVFSKGADPSP